MGLAENADEFAQRVAERVRERRMAMKMSKLAVARKAGLDQRAITFLETNSRVPSISTLYRVAFALDSSVEELVKDPNKSQADNSEN